MLPELGEKVWGSKNHKFLYERINNVIFIKSTLK